MDFEELICSVCEQHFDNDLHLPRMVPKCGHTFCSQCIEDIIETTSSPTEHTFCCPDDRIIIRLKNRDIGSFPINCLLASLVGKKASLKIPKSANKEESHLIDKKHNSSHGLSTAGSHANVDASIYSTNQNLCVTANGAGNHCLEHGKILEVVCIEDKCKVCSSCALFGSHRNHEIRPEGDVMKEVANRAETIIDLFQIIQKQEKSILDDHNMKEIERRLNEKQDELARMIQDKFKEFINMLKGQERRLLEELDDKFVYLKEKAISMNQVSQDLIECVTRWKASAETALTIMSEKSEKGDIAFELLEDRNNLKNDIIIIGEKLAHELNKNKEVTLRTYEGEEQKISVAFNDNFPKILDLLCQITSVKHVEQKFISESSIRDPTEKSSFLRLTAISSDDRALNSSRSRTKSPAPDISMSKRTTEGLEESTCIRNKENNVFTQDPRLTSPSTHFGILEYKRSEYDTDLLDFELKDLNIAELAESDHIARFAPAELNELEQDNRDRFRSVRKKEWENDDYEAPEALNNVTNRSVLNRSTTEKKAKPTCPRRVEDAYATLSRDASRIFKRSISPLKRDHSNERIPKSSRSKKIKEIQVNEKYEPVIEGIMYNIIESADLTGADLGDIGACKLAEYLRTNTKLRSLKLLKNKITDEGCIALANALVHNRSLQILNLTQNLLTEKTVDAFVEVIKTHKNLKTIYFNQNPISLRNVKTKVKELGNMGVSVSI